MSHVHTNSGIFISVMPGARMLRMVVMMLIEPMIDDAPMMWMAKIVMSMPMPACTDSGGYSVQPALAAPPGDQERAEQQHAGERQQPEAPVVHARERHVRRADHQRHLPVGEAHRGRHDRAENHDQAVHRVELIEELGLDELQARLEQLGADRQRHDAADDEHDEREPQVQRADVLVVGRHDPAHDPAGVMRASCS